MENIEYPILEDKHIIIWYTEMEIVLTMMNFIITLKITFLEEIVTFFFLLIQLNWVKKVRNGESSKYSMTISLIKIVIETQEFLDYFQLTKLVLKIVSLSFLFL